MGALLPSWHLPARETTLHHRKVYDLHYKICLTNKLLVHHVTIVTDKDVLVNHTGDRKHGKTSVVKLLVLVHYPALIAVIDPIGRTEKITRVVSRSGLDLLTEPLDGFKFTVYKKETCEN